MKLDNDVKTIERFVKLRKQYLLSKAKNKLTVQNKEELNSIKKGKLSAISCLSFLQYSANRQLSNEEFYFGLKEYTGKKLEMCSDSLLISATNKLAIELNEKSLGTWKQVI